MEEYKNPHKVTVGELIGILQKLQPEIIVVNGKEENIRVYQGRENKVGGRSVLMIR